MSVYSVGDKVFGKWEIAGLLGEGSYGKVWRIERHEFGATYEAALKVISVPASEAERAAARSEGLTGKYFYTVVENFVREIVLMDSLKGISSIVSYEDHEVIEHEDGEGWDILIRMELLTPLRVYMADRELGQMEVIRLGIQLCEALEECADRSILHRDIKPENIFVTKKGNFKLGDFGVARTLAQSRGALSQKGTASYMAPEVYRGEPYGRAADIYSLGIVLYQLMNRNRLPFYPLPPEEVTFAATEKALERRLRGEALPAPFSARGQLTDIIRRAAAFLPEDRYKTPGEMKKDLLKAYNSTASMYGTPARPEPEAVPGAEAVTEPEPEPKPESEPEPKQKPEPAPEPIPEPEPVPATEPGPGPLPEHASEPVQKPARQPKKGFGMGLLIAAMLALALVGAAAAWMYLPQLSRGKVVKLAAGGSLTVGLRSDGTVAAMGDENRREVTVWTDITDIAVGNFHTVGLRSDGTVAAVGSNAHGQCDVTGWRNIVAVAAGESHTVLLRQNGTVSAVGRGIEGQCSVSAWTDIAAIAAGGRHTVGLRSDGTVVAVGRNGNGQCDVTGWRNIVAVAAGGYHTVGLRSDGTVAAVGSNAHGQCDVTGWRNIVAVAAGENHTVGLCSDGTVVAAGDYVYGQCDVSDWTDIVAIATGENHTAGLRSDGTVVATGNNNYGQWDLIG